MRAMNDMLGLQTHCKMLINFLEQKVKGMQVILLHGLSGVCKTTIVYAAFTTFVYAAFFSTFCEREQMFENTEITLERIKLPTFILCLNDETLLILLEILLKKTLATIPIKLDSSNYIGKCLSSQWNHKLISFKYWSVYACILFTCVGKCLENEGLPMLDPLYLHCFTTFW